MMVSDRVCALWGAVRYVRWVRCVATSNVIMKVLLAVRAVGRAVGVIRVIFLAEVGVHSSSGQGTRRRRSLVLRELDELHDARVGGSSLDRERHVRRSQHVAESLLVHSGHSADVLRRLAAEERPQDLVVADCSPDRLDVVAGVDHLTDAGKQPPHLVPHERVRVDVVLAARETSVDRDAAAATVGLLVRPGWPRPDSPARRQERARARLVRLVELRQGRSQARPRALDHGQAAQRSHPRRTSGLCRRGCPGRRKPTRRMMNPGDPGNPGRGPMWSLHIPTTGPLAGIRLLCASPQGGISPAPLRTDRRDQLCVPTPISWMKLLQRATTQVSSRNQFPSRNPRSYSLGVRAYMPSRLHKTSMKLHASLHNTQDQPHPVYLNINYDVVLPPAEVGDLAALLAALEKLRARSPGIMKAAHPGSVRVQPTTASGGKVAPEMPIAWEKGGLALKPRRERTRVESVPLAQAEQHEQQQREQRQRERQRKRDERRQRERQRKQQREQERREQRQHDQERRQREQQQREQREQERQRERLRLDRLWAEAEAPPVVAVLSVEVAAVPAGSTGAQVGDVIDVQIPAGLVEAARRALMRQAYALPHC